jgi:hypothetical protein
MILCQTTHGTKRAQKDKPKNVWGKARLMREVRQGKGGEGKGPPQGKEYLAPQPPPQRT